ncbi:RHS repeat-associated core domain-containing protein [Microbulbifer sp. 2304DJ12-6]|uniref:RHS repeat-associated core domain-containing protein n=1 Tax=Microbulbifer sp. 2304DJ12-6 TaxID=3233340 RepID=UPI0039AEABA0
MTSWGKVRTVLAGFCAIVLMQAATAHDFGGDSAGDPPPEPPEPPPCERSPDPCCDSSASSVGDPIRTFDGGFYLADTDLQVGVNYPIRLLRRFDSNSQFDNALGYGWAFDHDRRLFEYPDGSVLLRSGCGRRDTFVFTGGAYVTPRDAPQGTLEEHGDGSYTFTYASGKRDEFDTDGRLVAIINQQGQSHRLSYDERGRLPLIGTSPNSVDPSKPMVVAYQPRLTRIEERGADGAATGASVDFFYDDNSGRLSYVIASDGRRINYHHDQWQTATRGNLVQVAGLDNYQHSFQYEDSADAHRITGLQRGAGAVWVTNTYDDEGRVKKQVEGQNSIELTYLETGITQITETVKSASGEVLDTRSSTFEFDEVGYLTKRIDPLGNELRQIYNDSKDRVRTEHWEKQGDDLTLLTATDYTYNNQAQKTSASTTLASGEVITERWAYDHGRVASMERVSSLAPGRVFRTEYTFVRDAQNRPVHIASMRQRQDDNTDAVTTYTYCSGETGCPDSALVKQIDGPRSDVQDLVTFTYYDTTDQSGCTSGGNCYRKGDLKTQANALGQTLEYLAYDAAGRVTSTRDANGLMTSYRYHPRGWLQEQVIHAGGEDSDGDIVTTYEYDDRGNVTKVTQSDGNSLRFTYDTRNRLTRIEDGEGNRIRYTLDSQGNIRKEDVLDSQGALSRTLSRTFDALNRLKQTLGAEQQRTLFNYDGLGRMTGIKDALDSDTDYHYDGLGRLVQSIEDSGNLAASTQFAYDAEERVTEVTDPRGNRTGYQYDLAGNLLELVSPDSGTSRYAYDTAGNRISSTDARGIISQRSYDALNRLIGIHYPGSPGENTNFSYDSTADGNKGIGRLTSYSNDAGSTSLTYDVLGRITQQDDSIAGQAFSTGYRYDSEGRVIEITYPSGRIVGYERDTLGRIATVTTRENAEAPAQTLVSNVRYQPFGGVAAMDYGNGITQHYGYDQDGRLQSVSVTGSGGDLLSQSYSYNPVDNITGITDSLDAAKNRSYDYDTLYRLTDDSSVAGQNSFTYDLLGNRTQQTTTKNNTSEVIAYGYESNSNRLSEKGGEAWSTDSAGNTTSANDGARQYTYNHANRLNTYSENGTLKGTYYYNAIGQRVRTDKTEDNLLHYDLNGQYLGETHLSAAGAVQNRVDYIYLDNMPIAQVEAIYTGGQVQSATLTYLHTDHLYTPRVGTSQNETVVWRWDSDAFGQSMPDTDPDGDNNQTVVNLRFPGQIKVAEAPYYYNYYRNYEPMIGRFIQGDPLGLYDGLNTYTYVDNNPLIYTDPTGEFGVLGGVIGGVVDLGLQLAQNGGNLNCVNWGQVAGSAALGALTGGLGSLGRAATTNAFKHSVSGAKWARSSKRWNNVQRRYRRYHNRNGSAPRGDWEAHHWAFGRGGRTGPSWRNHPLNLNPLPKNIHRRIHGSWQGQPKFNAAQRWWYGTPSWYKQGQVGGGIAGGVAGNSVGGGGGCECNP